MNFSDLYGHETIKKSLELAIAQDRISNAYVFEGIEGVGKKLCARIFSKALVCESKNPPCDSCSMCIKANANTLPDIVTVIKSADKTQIGVDNVREQVISEAYLKPRCARRKIFIIEQGDILSDEAQNALLKILEEPPSYVTFIICVTSKEKLLPTVLSRSQTVSFFPLPCETVEKYINDKAISSPDEAKIISKISKGSIGVARELLLDDAKRERIEKSVACLLDLKNNSLSIKQMTEYLTQEKDNVQEIIEYLLTFLRDSVLVETGLSDKVVFSNHLSDIRAFTQNLTKKKLISAHDKLSRLSISLKQNLNFKATVSEAVMRVWEDFHD